MRPAAQLSFSHRSNTFYYSKMFTPFHFESFTTISRTKYNHFCLHTARGKKRRRRNTNSEYECLTFPEKISWLCQNECKLRRKLTNAELRMKCEGVNRPKYMLMATERNFAHLFPILSNGIDWFTAYMLSGAHFPRHWDQYLWCICHRYRCDNIARIYFSSFRYEISMFFCYFCLLLIFSAWNNRIIRSKCLLSQMSSLNQ